MATLPFWFLVAGLAGLGSCSLPASSPDSASTHGRYVGVGIYSPGTSWTQIAETQKTKPGPSALPIDDQAIIVVEDSQTGEVRACGDLTGYCVSMNPWALQLPVTRRPPISMSEHQKQSDGTAAAASKPEGSTVSNK